MHGLIFEDVSIYVNNYGNLSPYVLAAAVLVPSSSTTVSSTPVSSQYSKFVLLFSVVSHTQLKFNVEFTTGYTHIQVCNFLNLTQLLSH